MASPACPPPLHYFSKGATNLSRRSDTRGSFALASLSATEQRRFLFRATAEHVMELPRGLAPPPERARPPLRAALPRARRRPSPKQPDARVGGHGARHSPPCSASDRHPGNRPDTRRGQSARARARGEGSQAGRGEEELGEEKRRLRGPGPPRREGLGRSRPALTCRGAVRVPSTSKRQRLPGAAMACGEGAVVAGGRFRPRLFRSRLPAAAWR